ncbi:molecular chaperone Hsp33 [Evansella caseinilytica]|uniref:Molecular chaperone Hsp33 n=1 Tax=Evansella caseinilytica TaxID=1503961 RepID=A0A1H3HVE1_9BACI|nr:Hsp33 family molecular chaperone HslO [Evansella caseinilytica]SDY19372.1 molecular chaperone Hsp33 [Evansella caseinilytica]
MENTVVKTLIYNKQVRLLFVDNTRLINNILRLNKETNDMLNHALGKTVSVMSLLAATLKGDQRISLQMMMSDRKYKIFADADASGNVRGYLSGELRKSPYNRTNKISLDQLVGQKGTIRVIKGSAMNQFTGIIDMPHRNIVDDISHYFVQSEQTPTYIKADITFESKHVALFSYAVFAQLLPGAPPELIEEIAHIVNRNQQFFTDGNKYSGNHLEAKLSELFKDVKIIGYSPVQFFCGCSKEMLYGMIRALSREELKQAMNKKEHVGTMCHICGRTYNYDQTDLQSLFR